VRAALPLPCEEYLSHLAVERGRAAATLAAYRRDLARWADFCEGRGTDVLGATDADVEAHLAAMRTDGTATSTVARRASSLRGLYGFLADEQMVTSDPTAHLAPWRTTARLPLVLTEEQASSLLASPTTDEPADVRDRAVLELLYGTGIRVSELTGLDLGDVDFHEELVRVIGKGDKQRLVPLGRSAATALRAWLDGGARSAMLQAARTPTLRAVFCNTRGRRLSRQGVDQLVRRHAQRAGLPEGTSSHTLRHTCATHMLGRGADVRVIQELLGHASVSTTQRYTKVTTSHLADAYLAAHPRAARDTASGV
jgi:integrase/recombinase XerD